jgi:hypothetical protein
MLQRQLLLIVFIFINVSIVSAQSLGDFARAERARRKGVVGNGIAADIAAKPSSREALIKEAVRVSGAKRQLEQALETFRPSLAEKKRPDGISAHEYQEIINGVFQLDRMTRVMERSVAEAVNDNTLIEIVRWYGSPLGRKLASAEINANGSNVGARLQHYAFIMQEKPISANRQGLIEGIISAAGSGFPRPPLDFDESFSAQGTALWPQFVYDSLSDGELSEYVTFLKSSAATAFDNSVLNGMDATFGDAAQHFEEKLAAKARSQF